MSCATMFLLFCLSLMIILGYSLTIFFKASQNEIGFIPPLAMLVFLLLGILVPTIVDGMQFECFAQACIQSIGVA